MDEKVQNLSSDCTARIVMDFSGKLEYWRWDVKVMNWSLIMAEPGNKCAEQFEGQAGESACQKKCLQRCDCKAYYLGPVCYIWTRDLVDLQEDGNFPAPVSVRVAISDIGTNPNFHMTLLAFTELLKLQLPAAVFNLLEKYRYLLVLIICEVVYNYIQKCEIIIGYFTLK